MPKLSVQLRLKPCQSPSVLVDDNFILIDNKKYEFNHIYDGDSTFYDIYQKSLLTMLESFISEYNCCIMCYGQTGSGKTYTMGLSEDRLAVYEKYLLREGEEGMDEYRKGNITRVGGNERSDIDFYGDINQKMMSENCINIQNVTKLNSINIQNVTKVNSKIEGEKEFEVSNQFNSNSHNTKGMDDTNNIKDNIDYFGIVPDSIEFIFTKTSSVSLTFIEVYNEEVIDLFTSYRTPINLRQTRSELSVVSTSITCTSKLQTIQTLKEGIKNRIVRSTKMNLNSSRSHAILTLTMNNTKFTFVDLAGSERLKKLETKRIKETISINSGLLALSNVITALAKKSSYVPFRDSKLTRILKNNLVNCNTLMLACIASDKQNISESLNTLKYAHRALNIEAVVKKNVEDGNKVLVELRNENTRIKYENERLKQLLKLGCNKVIVDENERLKNENEELKSRVNNLERVKTAYEDLKIEYERMVVNVKRANIIARRNSMDNGRNKRTGNVKIGHESPSNCLEDELKESLDNYKSSQETVIEQENKVNKSNNDAKNRNQSRSSLIDSTPEKLIKKLKIYNMPGKNEKQTIENPFTEDLYVNKKSEQSLPFDDSIEQSVCKIPATPMKKSKKEIEIHDSSKRRRVTFDLSKNEVKYIDESKKKKFIDAITFVKDKSNLGKLQTEISKETVIKTIDVKKSVLIGEPFQTAICIYENALFCSTLSGTVYKIDKRTEKAEIIFKEESKVKNLLIHDKYILYSSENKVKCYNVTNDSLLSHGTIYELIKLSSSITCMALRKDYLCIGTLTGHVHVYDLRNSKISFLSEQTHKEEIKSILKTSDVLYVGSTDIYMLNNNHSLRIESPSTKMFPFGNKIISIHAHTLVIIEDNKILYNLDTANYNTTGCSLPNSFVLGSKNGIVSEFVVEDQLKLVNEFNVDSSIVDIVYDTDTNSIYVATMKREVFIINLDK